MKWSHFFHSTRPCVFYLGVPTFLWVLRRPMRSRAVRLVVLVKAMREAVEDSIDYLAFSDDFKTDQERSYWIVEAFRQTPSWTVRTLLVDLLPPSLLFLRKSTALLLRWVASWLLKSVSARAARTPVSRMGTSLLIRLCQRVCWTETLLPFPECLRICSAKKTAEKRNLRRIRTLTT